MADSIVLCYHALSPTWDAELSTTPALLGRHVELLLRRGYRAMRFTELVTAPGADRAFAVTFDDAYRSVIALGLPVLDRLGVAATVFAPTDYISTERPMAWPGIEQWLGGPSEHELMPMSWQELGRLVDAGWEVGSHTASHPHLTKLADDDLAKELARSKAACERHLDGPCESIAYPYGDHDARVVAAAARTGYTAAGTLPEGRIPPGAALHWPRIGVYRADDERRFALKVSPRLRAARASRAWEAVQRLRR